MLYGNEKLFLLFIISTQRKSEGEQEGERLKSFEYEKIRNELIIETRSTLRKQHIKLAAINSLFFIYVHNQLSSQFYLLAFSEF